MKRLDLDDLPPKAAALLASAEDGEEVLLVRNGAVVARLVGGPAAPAAETQVDPAQSAEDRAKEIFELFRSSVEDEF
ncbi:MAG: type II toxin-antitoxin system prevent-host-death family antitoxin [Proteobacteria bacterium]|nr:type II toxin-antitoxin system prevent-host-death family antitoxin [Pseudomonadota bacterium]